MRRTSRRESFGRSGGGLGLGLGVVRRSERDRWRDGSATTASTEPARVRRLWRRVAAAGRLAMEKGLVIDMLPRGSSYAERFKMARDAGFEVVQAKMTPDLDEAEEIKKAAEASGNSIDSVMNMDHWKFPLSSGDGAVVEKSLEG